MVQYTQYFLAIALFGHLACLASDKKTKALFGAMQKEDIQSLIDGRADVNALDEYGLGLLERVTPAGPINIIRLLIENKVSVNAQDGEMAPLHTALVYNATETMKLLLEHKAYVDKKLRTYRYFLPDLIGDEPTAQLVMEHDAKFNAWIKNHSGKKYATLGRYLREHTAALERNPPIHITTYRNGLIAEIEKFVPDNALAQLTAAYLLDKKTNLDLVNEFNQARADETVAARDRRFNERRTILFMTDRSSYKPSCMIS